MVNLHHNGAIFKHRIMKLKDIEVVIKRGGRTGLVPGLNPAKFKNLTL